MQHVTLLVLIIAFFVAKYMILYLY